ncbi:MAG: SRPBCC domain-containing protein [Proteobacteria bacterium]|nr:SRPBCC domain-containing protein [Pseudomonadota bacterium]
MNALKNAVQMQGRNAQVMGPHSIRVTRSYDAKPEKVFRAWTDAASISAWLTKGEYASADVRPGGLFYLEMRGMEKINPHYGRYLRVESPQLLEHTWVSEWTHGKETVVLIEIAERDGKTELTLTHDGLPTEEMAESHRGGWSGFLDELGPRL